MKLRDVHRRIWQNTVSGYLALAVQTVAGLITFRLIFQYLSPEEFGFWALLWSMFGYGILLDFGLGVAVQREVARLSVSERWAELSEIVSTVFFGYCGLGALIAATAVLGSPAWMRIFTIDPENLAEFRTVFVVFFCGLGLAFPFGIFQSILRGQQRLMLSNVLSIVSTLVRLVGIVVAVRQEWSLTGIMLLTLACAVGRSLVSAGFALHSAPGLRLRLRSFNWPRMQSTTKFSAYAYVIMLSYTLQTKIDLLVIGSCLTVAAVALYQPGAKCGEMFSVFTRQLAQVLQPAAAHLHASGEHDALRRMLVGGMRYSVMLAVPGYLILAFHLEAVLLHLTGLSTMDSTTYWVAQILLLWALSFITTHNVYKRIAVMCGHERRLARVGVLEAGLNAGLSVVLVLVFRDVVWVALGSLIPTVLIGWGVLWRWAAKEVALGPAQLAGQVFGRTPWVALLLVAWFVLSRLTTVRLTQLDPNQSPWVLLAALSASGLVALVATWRLGLTAEERQIVRTKLTAFVGIR